MPSPRPQPLGPLNGAKQCRATVPHSFSSTEFGRSSSPMRSRRTPWRTCTSRSARASTSRSTGRRDAARRRSSPFWACSTRRARERTCSKPSPSPTERARIRNRRIGFVFQAFNLIGDLTVAENVELPLTYRGMSGAERTKRVQQALEKVGMSHRAKHFPVQLSGGQQQRVAVARAVVGDPAILLADEPTGNLDSTNGEAVMELLRTLHRGGATVCMVTHDPRYAKHADRSIHLFDGRVVDEEGTGASGLGPGEPPSPRP